MMLLPTLRRDIRINGLTQKTTEPLLKNELKNEKHIKFIRDKDRINNLKKSLNGALIDKSAL